jgi:Fur family transcriptional regulator, ferric uptake regulator
MKEDIFLLLKKKGLRITKQRQIIIDTILENECASCKEIFYQANKMDSSIGIATVYRMIKTLEDIGVINRRNQYKVDFSGGNNENHTQDSYTLILKDKHQISLKNDELKNIIKLGLKMSGVFLDEDIDTIVLA